MMRTPTQHELMHLYDPVKAHMYYEKYKPKSQSIAITIRHAGSKDEQRQELETRIQSLSEKLPKLEALITKRENEEDGENRKAKAKKERAAKDKDKPTTAAEKAKAARDSGNSNSMSDAGSSDKKTLSASDLRSLATKVKGQIAVAKQKLVAL